MLANNETGAIQPAEKIGDEILKLKENGHKVQYLVGRNNKFIKKSIIHEEFLCLKTIEYVYYS